MCPSHSKPFRLTLVLGSASLRELKGDGAARQSSVDLGVGVESVVDTATLLLIEDNLQQLAVVLLGAQTLADDFDGVDEVGEDGVVDGSQSSRTGSLLLLGVAGASGSLGAGQDAARGKDQDVAVGELLLELTGEAVKIVSLRAFDTRMVCEDQECGLTAAELGGNQPGRGRGQR